MYVARLPRRTKGAFLLATALLALLIISRVSFLIGGDRAILGQLRPVTKIDSKEKIACLTFDVAWGETVPVLVLNELKQKDVRASFFVAAPWAASHQDIVKRIVNEGHDLGNLGYRHVRLSRYPKEVIDEEISRSHRILTEIGGKEPNLFRPPDGDYNDAVITSALERGYVTVVWSLDSLDYKRLQAPEISKRLISKTKPGEIVLLHASDAVPETPEALSAAITALKEKGFRFMTVSEALKLQAE